MSKKVRNTLSVVISLVLFSALALAQGGGSTSEKNKDKNREHHSRLAKVVFWHRHKGSHKNAKQGEAKQDKSTRPQPQAAQVKPVSFKHSGKRDQEQGQHARKVSKARTSKASAHMATKSKATVKKRTALAHSSAKSHPAAKKARPSHKTQDRTTASLQQ